MAGAQRIRVAVAQLAYHPAARVDGRSPLEDPLFVADSSGALPSALRPPGCALDPIVEGRVATLERRVREVHGEQLLARITAILERCQRWGVELLVLPEYSVAAELLPAIAAAAGEVMVVAGSHVIDKRELQGASGGGIYGDLGWQGDARAMQGCAAAPVLHRGEVVHLQGKLHPSEHGDERARWSGRRFATIDLAPLGVDGSLAVLFGNDLRDRSDAVWRDEIEAALGDCRLLAVIASPYLFSPAEGRLRRPIERLGVPLLLALDATFGADTSQIVNVDPPAPPPFVAAPGEEALLLADVDLGRRHADYVGAPSLIFRVHPVADEYAAWSERFAGRLARADADPDADQGTLEALRGECLAARDLLLDVGALIEGDARDRRLRIVADPDAPIADLDHLRALTREVVLPRACLPLDHLGPAMARAALQQLYAWLGEEPAGASGGRPSSR
ncbi:MAG: hypothetical protein H6710_22055 [Myxococcales bacterium]|nr:hypothetical protein [Myxococcales bacterium]